MNENMQGELTAKIGLKGKHLPYRAATRHGSTSGDQLAVPTLAEGESIESLRSDPFDPDEAGRRGMAFERLDQLALEHLYGVRG